MKIFSLVIAIFVLATSGLAQSATPTPTPTPAPSPTAEPIIDQVVTPLDYPEPNRPSVLHRLAQNQSYSRPDAATRRKRFINSVVGPFALGKMVVTAGISTWSNSPAEWGTKWEGFGRRVASNFGKNAIKQTTTYGLDEAFKLDSHFYRSKSKSVGERVRNALISPVTARDRNGKRIFGFPRVVGAYASSIIAYETWYPDRYDWKHGVRSGTISLGFNAAFNLFREFVWKK